MKKTATSAILCALAMAFSGCVSVSSNVRTIGPATEISESDRKMAGKLTLVELDADGTELSRTDNPSAVFKGLGMSEAAIAAASTGGSENPIPAFDYMNFMEGNGLAKAQYPAGRRGHRRLEFTFPSPSKRCASMKYILEVEWRWRRNRVTRSRLSGNWNYPIPDACTPGSLRADRIGEQIASERGPGSVGYTFSILFGAPVEDLETGEVIEPASTDAGDSFGAGNVTVRGDGTARFTGRYGLAGK